MKRIFYFLLSFILLVSSNKIYAQAGALDPSFGIDGIVMLDLIGDFHETIYDMEILDDSSILLVGLTVVDNEFTSNGLLLKLNPDGSIQTEWGNDGYVTFGLGATGENTYANKLEVLPDGSFLVCGSTLVEAYNSEFYVAKFNEDGTLDSNFGTNGSFISSNSSGDDECSAMALQEDGKIILAGGTGYGGASNMLFVRINPDGSIDNTFGTAGFSVVNSNGAGTEGLKGVEVLSNGNIVGAGYSYQSDPYYCALASVVMIDANGDQVTNFGDNGVLFPEWATDYSYIHDVEVNNDDIYVTGWIMSGAQNIFLSKMDSDGNIDPSFGDNGVSIFNENGKDNVFDMYFGFDNKIYLCGNTGLPGAGAPKDILLIRYNMDGTIDSTLNDVGFVTTYIREDADGAFSVKLQEDGKIVLAGYSSGLSTTGNNDIVVTRYLNDIEVLSANFIANETEVCVNELIQFTDQSIGNVESWEWSFIGGSPETSSEQNPTVIYESAGEYDVELTVFDGTDYSTMLKEDYILVDDCTGLEENVKSSVSIYPNPCTDMLTLEFESNSNKAAEACIIDLTGRVIWKGNNNEGSSFINIDVSSFINGVYFIQIFDENSKNINKRFVKE